MTGRVGPRSPGSTALEAVLGLVLAGLVYGFAEYARQAWWLPSPPGIPGDSGGDPFAHAWLGLSVVSLPGLCAWFVLRAGGRLLGSVAWFGAWTAALLPTTMLGIDRAAELLKWQWTLYESGGLVYYLRLVLLGLLFVIVPALLLATWRPLRRAPARAQAAALLLVLVSPFLLAVSLRGAAVEMPTGAVPPSAAPCVLLLTVDTLRSDALAPYGGPVNLPEPLTPARVYEGWSVSSWTLPAMASLFSGLAPTGHGGERGRAPAPGIGWWPEHWAEQGWVTAAVGSNPFLRRRFAFDRGFAHFEHAEELRWLEPVARTFWAEWWQRRVVYRSAPDRADHRVERALAWLEGAPAERPWLLWVHFMDPHIPYNLRGANGALQPETPPEWISVLEGALDRGRFSNLPGARAGEVVTSAPEREALRRLYHTEVDFALHWIAELVRAAEETAGDRGLLWVLTSDHGEEFWEDGGFEHGHTLHDTVVRVPMLFGGRAAEGVQPVDGARMRLLDLGPLLTRAVGLGDFDPRPESGLMDAPSLLDAFAIGRVPQDAGESALLAEGVLYGPPRTLVAGFGGAAIERRDDTRVLRRHARWEGPHDSTAFDALGTVLLELDLWRERNAGRGMVVESDPDLERRLRAMGYVQ